MSSSLVGPVRSRLATLLERERTSYADLHPGSAACYAAADHLFGQVPMTWMNMWSGGFPLYLDRAWATGWSTSTVGSTSTSRWATRERWRATVPAPPSTRSRTGSATSVA